MSEAPPPNAVVPAGENAVALPSFMQQFNFSIAPAEELESTGIPMTILQPGKDGEIRVKRSGDLVATLPPGAMIVACPIAISAPKVMFERADSDSPCCRSDDGIIGIGDIKDGEGEKGGRECEKCIRNQWSSDPNGGKGKWCKESKLIALSCCGVGRLESNGRPYVNLDAGHKWWFDLDGLWTEKAQWLDGDDPYEHAAPVILRMTASSFKSFNKVMKDVQAINPAWPVEATVWMIKCNSETGGGFKYGVWDVQVAPMDESSQWFLKLGQSLKGHPSLERMASAGHQADGIINHD